MVNVTKLCLLATAWAGAVLASNTVTDGVRTIAGELVTVAAESDLDGDGQTAGNVVLTEGGGIAFTQSLTGTANSLKKTYTLDGTGVVSVAAGIALAELPTPAAEELTPPPPILPPAQTPAEIPMDEAEPQPFFQPPQGGTPPQGFQAPADGAMPGGQGFGGGMGNPDRKTDPDGQANVPYLIRFDKYVSGQSYQGYEYLSIRNYGTSYDAAMLQEPVTNDMARLVGLPATDTAYAGVVINDNPAELYVISEIIDEDYLAKTFENPNGVLYKAEVGSTLSYQGEDPSAYADSFSQETRENEADLAPLIAFMRFLDQADDATFEQQLPAYLDVDAFATYLAVNDLLVNTDSMLGMNNNYYLYWDDAAERFTLLMWDANESMSKLGGGSSYSIDLSQPAGGREGMGGRGGMGGGSNSLLTRFMAVPAFKALYEDKVKQVYEKVYQSGAALDDVERYAELVSAANAEMNLVPQEDYDAAVQSIRDFIRQRAEYLGSLSLLQ